MTWRVFDTRARARAIRIFADEKARARVHACVLSRTTRRMRDRRPGRRRREREQHGSAPRVATRPGKSTSGCVACVCVCVCRWMNERERLYVCVHDDDETSRRAAATQVAPRRDGPKRDRSPAAAAGPHLLYLLYCGGSGFVRQTGHRFFLRLFCRVFTLSLSGKITDNLEFL